MLFLLKSFKWRVKHIIAHALFLYGIECSFGTEIKKSVADLVVRLEVTMRVNITKIHSFGVLTPLAHVSVYSGTMCLSMSNEEVGMTKPVQHNGVPTVVGTRSSTPSLPSPLYRLLLYSFLRNKLLLRVFFVLFAFN